MWFTEKGIVIHKIKYSDSASIVKLFTRESGYKSFLVRGINSRKNKLIPFLQTMNCLEFETRIRDTKDLHTLKDVRFSNQFKTFHTDFRKSGLLIFMAEILYKTLEDDYENEALYDYLLDFLKRLDQTNKIGHVAIHYLLGLTQLFGFQPEQNYSASDRYFNLQTGSFGAEFLDNSTFLDEKSSEDLNLFLGMIFDQKNQVILPPQRRFELINGLIRYFGFHIDGMRDVKSHHVLKELFE